MATSWRRVLAVISNVFPASIRLSGRRTNRRPRIRSECKTNACSARKTAVSPTIVLPWAKKCELKEGSCWIGDQVTDTAERRPGQPRWNNSDSVHARSRRTDGAQRHRRRRHAPRDGRHGSRRSHHQARGRQEACRRLSLSVEKGRTERRTHRRAARSRHPGRPRLPAGELLAMPCTMRCPPGGRAGPQLPRGGPDGS